MRHSSVMETIAPTGWSDETDIGATAQQFSPSFSMSMVASTVEAVRAAPIGKPRTASRTVTAEGKDS